MSTDRALIFIHIPKTAGSTLRPIMDRHFPRHTIHKLDVLPRDLHAFRKLPEEVRARARLIQGHFPFGLGSHLPVPVDYLTMLREPTERIMSMYYWILGNQTHALNKLVHCMSLDDFASSGFEIATNHQTRLISGLLPDADKGALEKAKHHLGSGTITFGLNERFDESLLFFQRHFNWKRIFYSRRNVTKDRPLRTAVPRSTIALIEKHNLLDLELYEFAKNLFDQNLQERLPNRDVHVRRFQKRNRVWARFDSLQSALRRSIPAPVRSAVRSVMK